MFGDHNLRISIAAGIISALIVILLVKPILTLAGYAITWAGDHVYEDISRNMYTSAAIGQREIFSFTLLAGALAFSAGLFASQITFPLFPNGSRLHQASALSRILRWTLPIVSSLALVSSLFLAATYYADFQMNASFNQRLDVVAPQLTDQDLKVLRSRWASMQTRSDYLAIVDDMEQTAQQQGMRLPKLLWK